MLLIEPIGIEIERISVRNGERSALLIEPIGIEIFGAGSHSF